MKNTTNLFLEIFSDFWEDFAYEQGPALNVKRMNMKNFKMNCDYFHSLLSLSTTGLFIKYKKMIFFIVFILLFASATHIRAASEIAEGCKSQGKAEISENLLQDVFVISKYMSCTSEAFKVKLLKQSFAQDIQSQKFLNNLLALLSTDIDLIKKELGIDVPNMINDILKFSFTNESKNSLKLQLGLFKINPADEHASKAPHIVISGMFVNNKNVPVGYFARTLQKSDKDKKVFSYLDFIKMSPTFLEGKGITKSFIPFFEKEIFAKNAVKYEILEADWIGRLVWGEYGYKFKEDAYYLKNGQKIAALAFIQECFQNFLNKHKIPIEKLIIIDKAGNKKKITKVSDLQTPLDFVRLTHEDGTKVEIDTYIDFGVRGSKSKYDVGKAFLLGDYRKTSEDLDTIILPTYPDIHLSNSSAMPNWMGIKEY
ncbi:MAG: hypothetical protein HQK51_12675 [Oligoflexia bacterium]|nr:hypothetical protein [Oligoflexia bacterium]